ncbi:MAG: helix-turn-helix domain-containing protein, partial [Deltaproteobacteria bacterium]
MDTEQTEIQETQGQDQQGPAPQVPQSIGGWLKSERERLGLSQGRITEMTRMRTAVIDAIEREDWGSLPPPVFVRGFLRSYAKVLGISQESAIALYEKTAPPEPTVHVPRREPARHSRRSAWVVLLLLVAGIAVYGLWSYDPFSQINVGPRDG